jgi:tetratricopeptide (TPR) repeat protein
VYVTFRTATFLFACVLAVFCIWLLFAELQRPNMFSLPTDRQSAANAAEQRVDASWAAWSGVIRGDLWAQSAFTFADLLWTGSSGNSELAQSLDQARGALARALRYAPTRADAWIMLAELASRYHWSRPDAAEALRMSYYTGPNELSLMPLRTLVASQLPELDTDGQRLVRRDLHLLLTHAQKTAVIEAYHSATPAARRLIEQELGESDPNLVQSLRRGPE